MNTHSRTFVASAATSLFAAAAGVAHAAIAATGIAHLTGVVAFVPTGTVVASITTSGSGTLDGSGTFTMLMHGEVDVPGFNPAFISTTDIFKGTISAGTFTPSSGAETVSACTGSQTVCNGQLSETFDQVSGKVILVNRPVQEPPFPGPEADGTLTGTVFTPTAGTIGAVTRVYTYTIGTPVSLPPSAWLLSSGLMGLLSTVRRRRSGKT